MNIQKHPKKVRKLIYYLSTRSVLVLLVLFVSSHLLTAFVFALFTEVSFNGSSCELYFEERSIFYRFYFTTISQIAPGFTEFYPSNEISRALAVTNGFTGIFINAVYIAILVSQAMHPREIIEFCPYLIANPKSKKLEIRLYSKYPGDIHYIEFSFYRFFLHSDKAVKILGRTEEIKIHPKYRRLLKSNYPYIIRVELSDSELPWQSRLANEGHIRQSIPQNWLKDFADKQGNFYIIVKAETDAGTVFQHKEFSLSSENIKVGIPHVVFDDDQVTFDEWHDPTRGNWANWNQLDENYDESI